MGEAGTEGSLEDGSQLCATREAFSVTHFPGEVGMETACEGRIKC